LVVLRYHDEGSRAAPQRGRFHASLRQVALAAALACCGMWTTSASAEPAANEARLEIVRDDATRSCISEKALERSVERRLRRKVFGADARFSLRVAFERSDAAWLADLELSDADGPLGKRQLSTEARHCSALDDSLALVVALLVDTPPEREPSPPTTPEPSPEPARPLPPRRSPTPIQVPAESFAPREPLGFGARGSGLLAAGLIPGIALGAEVALELAFPRGPRVVASLDATVTRKREGGDGGAAFSSRRVGLELCGLGGAWGALSVEPCVGQRVGWIGAEGFDFDQNLEITRLYYSLAAGVDVGVAVTGALRVSAGLRGEFPLTRDRFSERLANGERDELFRVAPLIASTRIGLGVRF
jgi:hypothetical protein